MENVKFSVSQEFEIIPHQADKAYVIGVKEWFFLKKKLSEIKFDIDIFQSIGFLFLGVSASCLLAALTTTFTDANLKTNCFIVSFFCLLIGILSISFAYSKRKINTAKPKEIIEQMELIELRFKSQLDEKNSIKHQL
jgi:hypothetical protein